MDGPTRAPSSGAVPRIRCPRTGVNRTLPSGTATTRVTYGVALTGASAPHQMGAATVGAWAQTDLPTDATAISPPDDTGATPNLAWATLHYLNRDGRTVNVAQPGGHIATTEHDETGNAVRELSPANRARVLQGTVDPTEVDTRRSFSADGVDLLDEIGPKREITLPDGTVTAGRARTSYVFDEGAPPTGGPYRLVTTRRVGALVDGLPGEQDVRVTRFGYDDGGWTLHTATSTTADHSGLGLVSRTLFDTATGLELERRQPSNPGGGGPGSTLTRYYTAGAHPVDAACGNRPEWVHLACWIGPAAQPAGSPAPPLADRRYTYDLWHNTVTTVETAGAASRTTTVGYDPAGRRTSESVTASVGAALPAVTYGYDPATGRPTTTSAGGATISVEHDALGRVVQSTDAGGNVATTTYDALDRPVAMADGKGTRSMSYDRGVEPRGLPTSVVDSQAGTFSGTWDSDGALASQSLPNGLVVTTTRDATGAEVARSWDRAGEPVWLAQQVSESVHGQWRTESSDIGGRVYGYDGVGRLVEATDTPTGGDCATRLYGFDANTNRTSFTVRGDDGAGGCATTGGSSTSYTYDAGDRSIDPGIVYDGLGRVTTLPAQGARPGSSLSYFANDLVASITTGAETRTWTLDPARRHAAWSDAQGTWTQRFADAADAPAWVEGPGGSWERSILGLDGQLAAQATPAGVTLTLVDLHGDVIATAPATGGGGLAGTHRSDEYGNPQTATPGRYGWLGAHRREADTTSSLTLMGVRVYDPATGRFLQVDPIEGGSCNRYDYVCGDPINSFDLDGRMACRRDVSFAEALFCLTLAFMVVHYEALVRAGKAAPPWGFSLRDRAPLNGVRFFTALMVNLGFRLPAGLPRYAVSWMHIAALKPKRVPGYCGIPLLAASGGGWALGLARPALGSVAGGVLLPIGVKCYLEQR